MDVIPISKNVIQELESIQLRVGKSTLGVPKSTANPFVYLELGWKPIRLHLEESLLRFYKRVNSTTFKGSQLVNSCMEWNIINNNTKYMKYLTSMMTIMNPESLPLQEIEHNHLLQHHKLQILRRVQELESLRIMPIPRRWWKPSPFVEEFQWMRMLVKFRSMNSGLGNRDGFRSADAMSQDDGRITICPLLCLNGRYDEIHLLLSCSSMERKRRTIQMSTGKTLEYTLSEIHTRYSCNSDQEVARFFSWTRTESE